jgi:hypothetical protein
MKELLKEPNRLLWLLFIIPLTLLAIGLLYIRFSGMYFLHCVDPEYAYLFNGSILAQFHPDVQFTGHPGVPLQCLVAAVSHAVHLFRPGQTLVVDVLQNPELYIRATLYTANVINAAVVFFLGLVTYRCSRSILSAMFLQLTPFSHILVMESLGRLIPELIMCIIVCCWLMVLVKLFYAENNERHHKRYSLVFAVLFGLSMAVKMTFLSYFVLPLLVLPSWKLRLRYAIFSIISFMVFAFPAVLNHKAFFQWITGIFIHTGAYGGGEKGIIDWRLFLYHLKLLTTNTRFLLFSGITLLLITLLTIFQRKRHQRIIGFPVTIVFSVFLIMILQYAMASKHFAYHYMMPALLLTVFMIFLIIQLLKQGLPGLVSRKVASLLMGFAGLLLLVNISPKIVKELKYIKEAAAIRQKAYGDIAPLLDKSPRIISTSYYGCSAIEYALTFGILESGRYGSYFTEKVKELYPSTYLYFPWAKVFYEGNKEILPAVFIHPEATYTLYIAEYSTDRLNEILAALKTDTANYGYTVNEIFSSPVTAEAVFLLKINNISRADSVRNDIP